MHILTCTYSTYMIHTYMIHYIHDTCIYIYMHMVQNSRIHLPSPGSPAWQRTSRWRTCRQPSFWAWDMSGGFKGQTSHQNGGIPENYRKRISYVYNPQNWRFKDVPFSEGDIFSFQASFWWHNLCTSIHVSTLQVIPSRERKHIPSLGKGRHLQYCFSRGYVGPQGPFSSSYDSQLKGSPNEPHCKGEDLHEL